MHLVCAGDIGGTRIHVPFIKLSLSVIGLYEVEIEALVCVCVSIH